MYELSAVRIDHKPFVFTIYCVGKQTAAEANASLVLLHSMPATSNKELDARKGFRRRRTEGRGGRQRLEARLCDFNVSAKVQDKKSYTLCSLLQ